MTTPAPSILTDAQKYAGKVPYLYGGANPNGWDCSGFANYVLGHDLGMTLPGGVKGFTGASHGPVVTDYAAWSGAVTITTAPEAGDLVLFVGNGTSGHMGFVTGPNQMLSALDPQYGTSVTPIQGYGPAGAPIVYRRIAGTAGGVVLDSSASSSGGAAAFADLVAGALIGGGVASGVVVVSVAVAGVLAAFLFAAAVRAASS